MNQNDRKKSKMSQKTLKIKFLGKGFS